jgi:hypothetical protein
MSTLNDLKLANLSISAPRLAGDLGICMTKINRQIELHRSDEIFLAGLDISGLFSVKILATKLLLYSLLVFRLGAITLLALGYGWELCEKNTIYLLLWNVV